MNERPKLTVRGIESLKPTGTAKMVRAGDNLYLRMGPKGGKSWVFVWKSAGKRKEIGLGAFRYLGLADARDKAAECRRQLGLGAEPQGARAGRKAVAKAKAFREFAESYIAGKEAGWKNDKHKAQWRSTLVNHVYPTIGDKTVRDINRDDIVEVLDPIWVKNAETAGRVRARIERILDAAKAKKLRDGDNPARLDGHLTALLPERKKTVKHHKALPYGDLPAVFRTLQGQEGMGALALRFTILTAARSGEVRMATWSEIDLEAGLWTVPPDRMKAGREHVVPLCLSALDLLREHRKVSAGDGLIFPGQSKPGAKEAPALSDMTLSAVLRRMELKEVTVHGFRSTFRDWCGDKTDFPREVAEAALAHAVGDKAEQSYRRGTALEKRRELMKRWGEFVTGERT